MADNVVSLLFRLGLDPSDAQRASKQFSGAFASDLGFLRSLASQVALSFSSNIKGIASSIPLVGTAAYATSSALLNMSQAAGAATAATAQTGVTAAASGSAMAAMAGPIGIAVAAIIALTAAFVGLVAVTWSSVSAWGEYGDSIFKAMQKTGQSAEQLSVIKVASQEVGVSFDQMVRGIARMEANVSRGITSPTREAAVALRALRDEAGNALDPKKLRVMDADTAFRTLMTSLDNVKNRFDRERAAAALFGRDFQNLIPVLDKLGAQFAETQARTEAMGVMFTGKSAAQARQFQQMLKDVTLTAKGLAVSFGAEVGPYIAQALYGIMNAVQNMMPVIKGAGWLVASTIDGTVIAIQGLVIAIRGVPVVLGFMVESVYITIRSLARLSDTFMHVADAAYALTTGDFTGAMSKFGAAVDSAMKTGKDAAIDFGKAAYDANWELEKIIKSVTAMPKLPTISQGNTDIEFPTKEKKQKEQDTTGKDLKTLEVELKKAERLYHDTLDDIQNSFEDHTISMAEFVLRAVVAENTLFAARKAVLQAEADVVDAMVVKDAKTQADKELRTRELQEKAEAAVDEHNRNIAALNRKAEKDEIERKKMQASALVELAQNTAQNITDATRRLIDRRVLSEEEGEKRIIEAEKRIFSLRKAQLDLERVLAGDNLTEQTRVQAALDLLHSEEMNFLDTIFGRMQDARERDLENRRRYDDEILAMQRENQDKEQAIAKQELDYLIQNSYGRATILRVRIEQEKAIEEIRHKREIEDIDRERAINRRKAQPLEEYILRVQQLNRREELENGRHLRETEQQRVTLERELFKLTHPSSIRSVLGDTFANIFEETGSVIRALTGTIHDAVDSWSSNLRDFGQVTADVFSQVQTAVGDTVRSYILYGETGPAVLRKMAAEAIAAYASQAAVAAVFYFARGLTELFFDPAAAAADFAGSALYAGLAGGLALIGRGVAGDAFRQDRNQGTGVASGDNTGGTSGSDKSGPKVIEAGRAEYNVNITLRLEKGLIVDEVAHNFKSDGRLRKVINSDGQEG